MIKITKRYVFTEIATLIGYRPIANDLYSSILEICTQSSPFIVMFILMRDIDDAVRLIGSLGYSIAVTYTFLLLPNFRWISHRVRLVFTI